MKKNKSKDKYNKLEKKLGLFFSNKKILENVFVHKSILNESKEYKESNERLEFLGDAVLELVVSSFLFEKFPSKNEGELTAMRSNIVRQEALSGVSEKLDLGSYLILGVGERRNSGMKNPAILENTLEALIGAIFVEFGLEKAREFVERFLLKKQKISSSKDPKAILQEYTQEKMKITPKYEVIDSKKNENGNYWYTVGVFLGEKFITKGEGPKKKKAEEDAARKAFQFLVDEREKERFNSE